MENTIKFTEEEVGKINELRNEVGTVFNNLGQLSVKKSEIETNEKKLHERYSELVNIETDLFKGLSEKYGDGNYDIETGIFTPNEVPKIETTLEKV